MEMEGGREKTTIATLGGGRLIVLATYYIHGCKNQRETLGPTDGMTQASTSKRSLVLPETQTRHLLARATTRKFDIDWETVFTPVD